MISIDSPKSLTLLFIHRKGKSYIRTVVTKVDGVEDLQYSIYKSEDGFHDELTSDGIFAQEALPPPGKEIYSASVILAKYIKKNGYKVCNTIIQTKNGAKIR